MERGEHIAAHVSKGTYETIESIREEIQTDQSATVEELLKRGIGDWKLETAIEQYKTGAISIEVAAERAGLSHWEFLDVLEAREEPGTGPEKHSLNGS